MGYFMASQAANIHGALGFLAWGDFMVLDEEGARVTTWLVDLANHLGI